MTIILGFFAVLFAIPTFGLSLVGFFIFLFMTHKVTKVATDTRTSYDLAMESARKELNAGTVSTPTWATDKAAVKFLLRECIEAAVAAGLDGNDLENDTVQEAFAAVAMTAAHHFERQGFARSEQIVGAVDLTVAFAEVHVRAKSKWDGLSVN